MHWNKGLFSSTPPIPNLTIEGEVRSSALLSISLGSIAIATHTFIFSIIHIVHLTRSLSPNHKCNSRIFHNSPTKIGRKDSVKHVRFEYRFSQENLNFSEFQKFKWQFKFLHKFLRSENLFYSSSAHCSLIIIHVCWSCAKTNFIYFYICFITFLQIPHKSYYRPPNSRNILHKSVSRENLFLSKFLKGNSKFTLIW